MRIAIILKGISSEKDLVIKNLFPTLAQQFSVTLFETKSKDDAVHLASAAVENKFDIILAAGGDGTLHQVVNGMLEGRDAETELPILGLFPIGTGNDFARALGLTTDINPLIDSIQKFQTQKINVGKITYTRATDSSQKDVGYFINVADVGMGPEVMKRISNKPPILGIPYSYMVAILKTFFYYKLLTIKAITKEWSWQGKARTVAIANGKYFGQGLCVAPEAKPDDGIFSTFICGNVSVLDFIRYSIPLKLGKKVIHQEVQYDRCDWMELTAEETCDIEADGEYLGVLPARIEMMKKTIRFLMCKQEGK